MQRHCRYSHNRKEACATRTYPINNPLSLHLHKFIIPFLRSAVPPPLRHKKEPNKLPHSFYNLCSSNSSSPLASYISL